MERNMKNWLMKQKKNMTLRKAVVIFSLLFFVALHLVAFASFQQDTSYIPYFIQRGDVRRTVTFDGTAEIRNPKLVYSRYASRVRSIFVREGEKITMGSKLILLENGKLITSEMNGYVGKINIREQEYVNETTNLLELFDLNQMTGTFDINEYDITHIAIGQECEVTIPNSNQKLPAKISSINMNASQEGGLAIYKVGVDLDALEGVNLLPGMQLYLSVDTEVIRNCAYVPAEAIFYDEENNAFVIIKKYGQYYPLIVSIDLYNGQYAAITEGLEGQMIVYGMGLFDEEEGSFLGEL